MSEATKRKLVVQELLNAEFKVPGPGQKIVKVLEGCGNNLHSVLTPEGDSYLVSMPSKYRKIIWLKRGHFVLTDPIEEGDKVKGEIVRILTKDYIVFLRKEGVWPKEFEEKERNEVEDLLANPNRAPVVHQDTESDSDFEDDVQGAAALGYNPSNNRAQSAHNSDSGQE